MTIIQKHGSKATLEKNPNLLQPFQLGYAVAEGDYDGDLYINENGGVHPITAAAEKRVENKFTQILNEKVLPKINKGKLTAITSGTAKENTDAFADILADTESKLEANDQFIVKGASMPGVVGEDVVLYIIQEITGEEDVKEGDLHTYDDNLVARPVTALDLTYHDPVSAEEINLADLGQEAFDEKTNSVFGITVGEVNETENTVKIGLSEETKRILSGVRDLGLVGGAGSTDVFGDGFVNKIELVKGEKDSSLVPGSVGNESKPYSAIQLKISGWNKNASNKWDSYNGTVTIDLNDLVIDEGSWTSQTEGE